MGIDSRWVMSTRTGSVQAGCAYPAYTSTARTCPTIRTSAFYIEDHYWDAN